ncbi:carboxyltransferase domain-containing protein [Serratia ureilytica]
MEYSDNVLDLALRLRIHLLMQSLRREAIPGVAELAPGVRSLQIRYDSRLISQADLLQRLLARTGAEGRQPPEGADAHRLAADGVRGFGHAGGGRSLSADGTPRRLAAEQRRFYSAHQRPEPTRTGARHPVRRQLPDPRIGRRFTSARPARCRSIAPSPAELQIQPGAHPHRRTVGIGGMAACAFTRMDSPGGYQLVGRTLPIWNKFLKNPQFTAVNHGCCASSIGCASPGQRARTGRAREAFREGRHAGAYRRERIRLRAYTDFGRQTPGDRRLPASPAGVQRAKWRAGAAMTTRPRRSCCRRLEDAIDGDLVSADLNGGVWKIILVEPGRRWRPGSR